MTRPIALPWIAALALALPGCGGAPPAKAEPYPTVPYSTVPYPTVDGASGATRRYQKVVFRSHQQHVDWLGGDCVICHHPLQGIPDLRVACSQCHGHAQRPLHQLCVTCHLAEQRAKPSTTAPTNCLGCHIQRR